MAAAHTLTPETLAFALRGVTEAAARAAYHWIGRGDKNGGDQAAVTAMRAALNVVHFRGKVVIGEGAKDEAPELYQGEKVGSGSGDEYDIAVDPVEGTTNMAENLPNSMAVIAAAPAGSMLDPGPCYYMEKFAAPPVARGKIDMAWPLELKMRTLSELTGKPISDLTVFVLDKPRHDTLVADLRRIGVRVAHHPAGDVGGALMAAIPNSGIDCLMGTGGTPEGIITACAIRALGGTFLGRLDPQKADEKAKVAAAGLDTKRWYRLKELVTSDKVAFCATGITSGMLFDGVSVTTNEVRTQSLLVSGATGERQILTTFAPRKEAP
ncbi:MAG: class II fructose-bisphosphatase [Alphaproteobacteria bacterium]|nr:class II fructose-bisphosphatase [Alphaproteobacteria bacterium]